MKPIGLVPELAVSNLRKSLDFYRDLLGFTVVYSREEENFAYLQLGNAEIMLDQIGSTRTWETDKLDHPFGRGVNFQIEVENIDGLYQKLQTQNISIFLSVEDKWYRKNDKLLGQRQFAAQDPDGYLLRFYQDLGTKE